MSTTSIRGIIKRYNQRDTGFVLEDRDAWFNFSQFGEAATIIHPPVGAEVELAVDSRNYVQALSVLQYPATPPDLNRTPLPQSTAVAAAHQPAPAADLRETRIIRQAVLKAAAELYGAALAAHPDRLGEILATAEVLEGWVLR